MKGNRVHQLTRTLLSPGDWLVLHLACGPEFPPPACGGVASFTMGGWSLHWLPVPSPQSTVIAGLLTEHARCGWMRAEVVSCRASGSLQAAAALMLRVSPLAISSGCWVRLCIVSVDKVAR